MSLTPIAAELIAAIHVALAAGTGLHALMNSRDPRAAWGWISACWLAPLLGPALYLLFGIHRVPRAGRRARAGAKARPHSAVPAAPEPLTLEVAELVRIGDATTGRALTAGNAVDILHNGDEAYPAMLHAIESARHVVLLSTYLFRGDATGRAFATTLGRARQRGVEVRVLIDAVGDLYYWPRGSRLLRAEGVEARRFQLGRGALPLPHLNLRNHRKLLVVDDELAFVGGLNIGDHHWLGGATRPAIDMHFRIQGPAVAALREVFAEDWQLSGGPPLLPAPATSSLPPRGTLHCRAIADGPLEEPSLLELILLGALANAHTRVSIMTPYFVPMSTLSRALEAAALRGVEVSLLLPERSNLPWVDWATRRWIESLIERGVKVYLQDAFVHSKLLVIDDYYVQVGSANLDARSLRLNFELNVEVYGAPLATRLQQHFDRQRQASRPLTLADLRATGTLPRVRDALCWLFSAYL